MINIDEIKKLPVSERIRIIDELWQSIEEEKESFILNEDQATYGIAHEEEEESPEITEMLEERWSEYKKGNGKSYSIEEVMDMLEAESQKRKKNN